MKRPRIAKRYATAYMFDYWENGNRVEGSGSFALLYDKCVVSNHVGITDFSWAITARMKEGDQPSPDKVVARSK